MANICCNDLHFVGDKEDIEKLHNEFMKLNSSNNSTWVGNMIEAAGKNLDDYEDIRAFVAYVSDIGNDEKGNFTLDVDIESKWIPAYDFFKFLNEEYENVLLLWYAEEPGCEIYETNDYNKEYFKSEYVVDSDSWCEYMDNLQTAKEAIKSSFEHENMMDRFNENANTFRELEDLCNEYTDFAGEVAGDKYLMIHKIRICD